LGVSLNSRGRVRYSRRVVLGEFQMYLNSWPDKFVSWPSSLVHCSWYSSNGLDYDVPA